MVTSWKKYFFKIAKWHFFLLCKIEFPFNTCLFIICERLETQLVICSCIHFTQCIYFNNLFIMIDVYRYNSPLWATWKRTSSRWISRERPIGSCPFSRRLTNTRLSMRVRFSNTLSSGTYFIRSTRIDESKLFWSKGLKKEIMIFCDAEKRIDIYNTKWI